MRLASRVSPFALLLCATISAHAAPEPDDSLRAARLGVSAGTPEGRYAHSAIVDPIGHRMVMHGGLKYAVSNDLWEFALEGTAAWSPLPVGSPASPVRGGHVAVLDTLRRRMLVFACHTFRWMCVSEATPVVRHSRRLSLSTALTKYDQTRDPR